MRSAARKLNFLIEENICRDLETLVPAGKRSKVVNDALRRELELIRRVTAVDEIIECRQKGRKFSNKEILNSLLKDRQEH
jgi:hypothetical protein